MARPLPPSISAVIQTLQWPLDTESSSPMMLESLERLAEIRSPSLPTGEDVVATVTLLGHGAVVNADSEQQQQQQQQDIEGWSRIATALLLLGHGFCDEAHNLVGPLSFPNALPFYHGPPVASTPAVLAAASHAHCLVHRREGPHTSEFGMSGFENSNFWSGATLRSGGEETLPLVEIQQQVSRLAKQTSAAQQWFETKLLNAYCEWTPRPLTELCAAVMESDSTHVLHNFAQQAALIELRVLLQHALTKLGYDTTTILDQDERTSSVVGTSTTTKLPHTLDQALNLENHAVVVTCASAPHEIKYVNQCWIDLCGYTRSQAVGSTFAKLIQGPDTNTNDAAAMVRRCKETLQPQEAYLVNYTAAGERFLNHVTIGPLQQQASDSNSLDLLVGILERVERVPSQARVAASV